MPSFIRKANTGSFVRVHAEHSNSIHMKKAILMFLSALGLSGIAQADYSVTLDGSYYQGMGSGNASWVYVWTGKAGDGNTSNGNNWGYLQDSGQQQLSSAEIQTPINYDPAFIGFDYTNVDGRQVMTANNDDIVFSAPSWMGANGNKQLSYIFLGNNVTFQGASNGFSGNAPVYFNFGDMAQTSSKIEMGDFWAQGNSTVTFAGTLDMTSDTFTYTLFHSSAMYQDAGTWVADFTITDQYGQTLQYAEAGSENVGKDGYYWLETEGVASGDLHPEFSVSLVAQATPEPTTATLSLLALAGLCARRRRK